MWHKIRAFGTIETDGTQSIFHVMKSILSIKSATKMRLKKHYNPSLVSTPNGVVHIIFLFHFFFYLFLISNPPNVKWNRFSSFLWFLFPFSLALWCETPFERRRKLKYNNNNNLNVSIYALCIWYNKNHTNRTLTKCYFRLMPFHVESLFSKYFFKRFPVFDLLLFTVRISCSYNNNWILNKIFILNFLFSLCVSFGF